MNDRLSRIILINCMLADVLVYRFTVTKGRVTAHKIAVEQL